MSATDAENSQLSDKMRQQLNQKLASNQRQEIGGKTDGQKDKLNIKIYSPYKVYFNAEADSISATNETGPFDVLPRHHNFISILKAGEIKVRFSSSEQRFKIDRGIIHVKQNQVVVFLDV